MKICVIIPTYNEQTTIVSIVEAVRLLGRDCVVVDDGSRDDTARKATDAGAIVIRNRVNEGKGASLMKGFTYARENGYEAVITMDGDGQHLPSDIPLFIKVAASSGSGIFIGNRMKKTSTMPWTRQLTNIFMSRLISLIVRQNIPDTQCGFRLIRRVVLEKTRLSTANYETESELLIRAAKAGFIIESVLITTVYGNEKSRINPFIDTIRFIRFIIGELLVHRNRVR